MPSKSLNKKASTQITGNVDMLRRRMTKIRPSSVILTKGISKRRLSVSKQAGSTKDGDDLTETGDADTEDWMHSKTLVKPDDQLYLTEAELKEEFTRILTANNPHAPQNIVRFNFKERQYKPISTVDQLAVHFTLDGNIIHKDSDEARRQFMRMNVPDAVVSETAVNEEDKSTPEGNESVEGDSAKENFEVITPEEPVASPAKGKLTNQFNFSERASQTYNNPIRDAGTMTEPPPKVRFSSNVSQWEIFDAYIEDFEKQQEKKEKEKKGYAGKKEEQVKKKLTNIESTTDDISSVNKAAMIIERMVNQNTYDDIAQDFKYWEDGSDEFRDLEGTLLPLWKFSFDKAKHLTVTSLCWNPKYKDLFAVSFGSYDFGNQYNGMILLYTLKNPSYPKYYTSTDCGVMCLDIHPVYCYMLCAGLYDGSVAVYNFCNREPLLQRCTAKNGKHLGPVWEVRWQKDNLEGNALFYSISSDGRIVEWIIVKNELLPQEIIKMPLPDGPAEGPDGTKLILYGCGTTFDFHSEINYLYIAGTEEGHVHSCSKAYSTEVMSTIKAHHMSVYKIAWNKYHPKIFITCSADWTVKIWEHGLQTKNALFTFDLSSSVGDVAWAPYSSTVFAAVTDTGKVFVYDLSLNKYDHLCSQVIVQKKRTKLTHIAFNNEDPVIIVGDDRGDVTCLKLSPNLRKQPKQPDKEDKEQGGSKPAPYTKMQKNAEKKGQPALDKNTRRQQEIAKLEKVLNSVREST
ncbi:dynein intermediate chain 2, ciliary isoform X1 [Octopus bimaculoides]|uniref:dynein intermediate chain 2, ciliary isoform X1 n=1 Tax=Octopus bimaculoides TaxID=37653 RepID=UPI00071D3424|nr:dynein intermediate chain 2, ciliary isoform X1 [Octopus bimaculoides]|eukprot:XP_014779549.1 PREDICTED: dynein intermediate chain 2, ciliary-like isoform X2 [Octopus bimaculoides]